MIYVRKIIWISLYLGTTLFCTVLFNHGTENFGTNFVAQLAEIKAFAQDQIQGAMPAKKPGSPEAKKP